MIIVLVGPKGAGKTTLARMLHAPPAVEMFDIEALAQRVLAELGGTVDERYAARVFEDSVRAIGASTSSVVIVESTAASTSTQAFFEALGRLRPLRFVRILAREETCADRIATRDPARQVAISADMIRAMHARSLAAEQPWSLELVNDPPLSRETVEQAFAPLFAEAGVTRSDRQPQAT